MIARQSALFCLVDLQEKLFVQMQERTRLQNNLQRLLRGLQLCEVELFVLQQYTKGIGETIKALQPFIGGAKRYEKTTFSGMQNRNFAADIEQSGKQQIIVAGTEAHVCVAQTSLELLQAGYEVYLVTDCISSRKKGDKEVALQRLIQAGIKPITYEAVLFELIGDSKDPLFKQMLEIIR
ncbi:MAG: isochorismatase family protein [Campylobacterota bacterium]